MPDSVGGKNATFEVKIAKPPNDFVGENTLSITAIDSSMRTAQFRFESHAFAMSMMLRGLLI